MVGMLEREAIKRRLQQEHNKAVAKAFEDIVTKSIKVDERPADERHKHSQEQYYNKLKLGDNYYNVDIFVDFLEKKITNFDMLVIKQQKLKIKYPPVIRR